MPSLIQKDSFELNKETCKGYFATILDGIENCPVIVTDSDETVSLFDSSEIFFKMAKLKQHQQIIKNIFQSNGISHESFVQVRKEYLSIPNDFFKEMCMKAAKHVKIRDSWATFLNNNSIPVIFVTAGITELWEQIIKLHKWENVRLIGSKNTITISSQMKGELITYLHNRHNKVMAFGDSRLDYQMLIKSDAGFVIPNVRGSIGLAELLKDFPHIKQIIMDYAPIKNLPVCSFNDALNCFLRS